MAVDLSEVREKVPTEYREQFDMAVSVLGDDERQLVGKAFPLMIAAHEEGNYPAFFDAVSTLGAQYAGYAPVLYAMLDNNNPR